MKLKTLISAALLFAAPTFAQAVTELLQKGIYAQDTSGNFDEAIMIYRQIVNSASGQRDIAAQAQYRLAETYIRKGDLANAATEFQKLARDYPDQQALISKLAQKMPEQSAGGGGRGPAITATAEFLAKQLDDLKRGLEQAANRLQTDLTPEERSRQQAQMEVMKARLVELEAAIVRAKDATNLRQQLELQRVETQGKSK
jgi:tetratricopeptide (TPR) repeat protein